MQFFAWKKMHMIHESHPNVLCSPSTKQKRNTWDSPEAPHTRRRTDTCCPTHYLMQFSFFFFLFLLSWGEEKHLYAKFMPSVLHEGQLNLNCPVTDESAHKDFRMLSNLYCGWIKMYLSILSTISFPPDYLQSNIFPLISAPTGFLDWTWLKLVGSTTEHL